ncbi:MAG: DUF2891 domain-containing protein [Haloferacaceae archaeon]
MEPLSEVDTDTILAGESGWIAPELAGVLSHYPLDSLETEYPHYAREVDSPDGVARPSETHPVFFGCYDWHSAVHSHWALIRQLRLFDDHPRRSDVVSSIDARLTPENVQREVEHFQQHRTFEKPYGWAWFLHLVAELTLWEDDRGREWRSVLEPLERTILELVRSEFLTQERPFRVGTHHNTAFALQCVLDYARTVSDHSLESAVAETAREFFDGDRDSPVEYEPFGWDFLSPALAEADLMRRVYGREEFGTWVDRFFPDLTAAPYEAVLDPVRSASDPEDGVALHLVGLNLSKAWAAAGLASSLEGHRYAGLFERSARDHAERGLAGAFTDDYAGAHWLSSFVLYLLTRNEGGIAPGAVAP